MKNKPTLLCGPSKNASARFRSPPNVRNRKGCFFSVSSVLSVLKVFSRSEQSFQHRGHRDHRENHEGKRRADFCSSNVWLGGLGRTKRPVGFGRAAFARSSKAVGAAHGSSRRNVCILVSAAPRIRDDCAKFYISRDEGRNRPGGIRWRDGRVCRGEDQDGGGRRVWLSRGSSHPRETASSFAHRAAVPPRISRRKSSIPIRCPGD